MAGPSPSADRWTFVTPTLLGDSTTTFEARHDALVYTSDDAFDSAVTIRWSDVREGATALLATGSGGPDRPDWAATRLEWLVLSMVDGRSVMRRLPVSDGRQAERETARDAIVRAVSGHLASRWRGERLALSDAQRGVGGAVGTTEAWLMLIGVFVGFVVLAIATLLVLALLLTPPVLAMLSIVAGLWLLRHGSALSRGAALAADLPVVGPAAAARTAAEQGLVHVEGTVVADDATTTAVTGVPAVWWDAAVYLVGREGGVDVWNQVAGRHGGTIGTVVLEEGAARVAVWLDGADFVGVKRSWSSEIDALPAAGHALLAELGFEWNGATRIRIVEESVDIGSRLSVIGTAAPRGAVPTARRASTSSHVRRLVATGEWRRALVAALPPLLRPTVAVFIGYVDLLVRFGSARARPLVRDDTPPPDLDAATPLIWRGARGDPFVVSNRPLDADNPVLRQRSLLYRGVGVALLAFAVYEVASLLLRR